MSLRNKAVFIILAYFIVQAILNYDQREAVVGPYPVSGKASWHASLITATGEHMDSDSLTCALRKKDYGKYYMVCSMDNEKCVVVRHNDFGPGKRLFNQGRIIDLSRKAFLELADLETGIINVTVTEIK